MTATFCSALVALAVLAGGLAAQPAPKSADDAKLVTAVYDIKPLLGDRGKTSGIADADAIIKTIFDTNLLHALKPGTDGPQIVVRDGGRLEVRAPAKVQAEIKDLLDAIARLQDVAVDVKADVYELDPAAYEALVKAVPKGTAKPPVLFATGEEVEGKDAPAVDKATKEMSRVLKAGRVVQTSSGRFVNGAEASLSARQSVATFHTHVVNDKPAEAPQFVKEGFKLIGTPVVSADRRFVRLKLTEQSVAVSGVRTRELGEVKGQKIVAQSLETADLGATGSAVVADGGTALFRLAYAPKDKVWVVVLKPAIFIQSEEDELKKQEKK